MVRLINLENFIFEHVLFACFLVRPLRFSTLQSRHLLCFKLFRSVHILYGRKYLSNEIFANFTTCLHGRNFYPANFLSRIDDYTEDMATFTTLAKIYSSEYFCNARVARIGEIFVQRKISAIYGMYYCSLIPRLPDHFMQHWE